MAANTRNTGRHAERGRDLRRSIVVSSVGNVVDMWCLELSARGWPPCRCPRHFSQHPSVAPAAYSQIAGEARDEGACPAEGRRKRRGEPEARDMIGLDPD